MIIGVDANEANVEKKVGVSEFAFELLRQYSQLEDKTYEFISYLKKKPNQQMPLESGYFKYKIFGPGKAWTQLRLPLELYFSRPRPDVFYTPSHYSPRFSPVNTVVSVMDLSYIHYPSLFNKSDLYQLTNWTEYSVKKARAVITISKASRSDIIKLYGKPERQVHVVYPGIKNFTDLKPHIYAMNELQSKYNVSNNYFLFVGTLQPRKNITRLIEAFSNLHRFTKTPSAKVLHKNTLEDLQLVIIGKKGWMYEEIIQAPQKYGIKNEVKFLDFVPDSDLPLFYKNAICMVWPSLYEGFGLPVLEAMKHDCPVITSNTSSLPEAGGDACLYVNPLHTEDIQKQMLRILNDHNLRKKLIEKGRKHVTTFSWEKAAKETLDILKNTVNGI